MKYMSARKVTVSLISGIFAIASPSISNAQVNVAATTSAIHMSQMITGGTMPTSSSTFTTMVSDIASGDLKSAAVAAANSPFFCNYLARRLAYQMQNPTLSVGSGVDSDATTYIVAHFCGGAATPSGGVTSPSISTLLSENATYLVNVNGTNTHAFSITGMKNLPALSNVNWMSQLVQVDGQTANSYAAANNALIPTASAMMIPQASVGGYATLSTPGTSVANNDASLAFYGTNAGTNLRYIESIWEISTGFTLLDAASTSADPSLTPRFVPISDPNFFVGVGQPACLSCHGGGMADTIHGYATVADVFDFNSTEGFTYNAAPTTAAMKSLASASANRALNSTCNLSATPTPVCNPESTGVGTAQSWDVGQIWSSTGFLTKLGWTGALTGTGLNSLGAAIGQASVVYQFLATRIVNEICPMGAFTQAQIDKIANAANPNANPKGTDDIRTMVAMVASDPSCQ